MKERFGYELPSLIRGEVAFLPDYVTVSWKANGRTNTVEVHPDRALDFIEKQQKLEAVEDWWFE